MSGRVRLKSNYQLRIVLKSVKPPVWRRVLVPGDITLAELHQVIQTAMGWADCHLHEFRTQSGVAQVTPADFRRAQRNPRDLAKLVKILRAERAFMPREALAESQDVEAEDEAEVTLAEVCPRINDRLLYAYDFGDGWTHDVIVQKILPVEAGVQFPVCKAGKRACPPEDCGGPWGYERLLEVLSDLRHDEHTTMLEWVGAHFDPEAFDLQAVNKALAGMGGAD